MNPESHSKWTMPVLRVSMGIFLGAWGVDKFVALEGAQGIFSRFYSVDLGTLGIQAFGVLEILLAVALIVGYRRVPVAWITLIVNGISTFASWRYLIDPWGTFGISRGNHLFLASYVIFAASIVLVLNARDDTFTVDGRRAHSGASESVPFEPR